LDQQQLEPLTNITPGLMTEADNTPPPSEPNCIECQRRLGNVQEAILNNFPELLLHFLAALAVCGILALKKGWKPVALVFEGLPGPGKSLILNCILGAGDKRPTVKAHLYRSDKFTTASFVSQSATVPKDQLKGVDLLPKIRQKVLITPELAPTFRGKREEVEERFGMLARVLDGRGLTLDGGTHGKRGYEGDYAFVWLGATTPLPETAFEAMASVGNRIFFYTTAPSRPSHGQLAQLARVGSSGAKEEECTDAIAHFLDHFYTVHKLGSMERPQLMEHEANYLASAARAIAKLRAKAEGEHEYEYRLVEWLSLTASARALIDGAAVVTTEHLRIIEHMVTSAARPYLRPLLATILKKADGKMNAPEVEAALGCCRDTALERMHALAATGVCVFHNAQAPKPSSIELTAEARHLIIDNFGGESPANAA
jgi:hypothetical protein